VHVALNALNWPADGCVTTNSADALMTPPPTGTSAVLTGVPLAAAAPDEPAEDPEPAVVDELVALDAAAPVVGGVLDPPQAARAAAPATPVPPTPAARSTVRRFTTALVSDVAGDVEEVMLSGWSDIAASSFATLPR
jgi:hypothetical protein